MFDGNILSGFRECWCNTLGWGETDFKSPTILEIWDFRAKDKLFAQNRIKLADVRVEDIKPNSDGKAGMARTERQWMQVDFAVRNIQAPYSDRDGLQKEIDSWTFPLHFIDFETSMPAIPFKQGRRPYEGLLFQFSHHTVDGAGPRRTHG